MKNKKIYGVAGSPILHSKSPDLFRPFLKKNKCIYTRFSTDKPEELIAMIKELNISGLNITTPLKEKMVDYLDYKSYEVVRTNAVNTILYKDGKLYGYNTDLIGVKESLSLAGTKPAGKLALVIGSGGAGRAAACTLVDSGADVFITNRSGKNLEKYSEVIGCKHIYNCDLEEQIKKSDIIVNTAPTNSVKNYLADLTSSQTLLNADYRNPLTIKEGPILIDGFFWLLFQGIASYRIFFKKEVDISKMSESLLSSLENKDPERIALIGFMGSGKSSIGKKLGEISGKLCVDLDKQIENEFGNTIEEIFAKDGEKVFRKIESQVLRKILNDEKYSIFSIGGGAVLERRNLNMLKKHALNVWLWSPQKYTEERLKKSPRPLIKKPADIEKIFSERIEYYGEAADIVFANMKDLESLAGRIKEEWQWE